MRARDGSVFIPRMFEAVAVCRDLSYPAAAHLVVFGVAQFDVEGFHGKPTLTMVHRGRIFAPRAVPVTQEWLTWLSSFWGSGHLEATSDGVRVSACTKGAQLAGPITAAPLGAERYAVSKPKVHGLEGVPVFSEFDIEFETPGQEFGFFGFEFSTNHGIQCDGGESLEMAIEGPLSALDDLHQMLYHGEGGPAADLDRRLSDLYDTPAMAPDAYSVCVIPHPLLDMEPVAWRANANVPAGAVWRASVCVSQDEPMPFAAPTSPTSVVMISPRGPAFRVPLLGRLRELCLTSPGIRAAWSMSDDPDQEWRIDPQ